MAIEAAKYDKSVQEMAEQSGVVVQTENLATPDPTLEPEVHVNVLAEVMRSKVRVVGIEAARILQLIERSNGNFNSAVAEQVAKDLVDAVHRVQFVANSSRGYSYEVKKEQPQESPKKEDLS